VDQINHTIDYKYKDKRMDTMITKKKQKAHLINKLMKK
jgi:hypothetical protein